MSWNERLEQPLPRMTILVMENKIHEYFPQLELDIYDDETLAEIYETLCGLLKEDPYEGYILPQNTWSGTYDE